MTKHYILKKTIFKSINTHRSLFKRNEDYVSTKLLDKKKKIQQKILLGDLVRTADKKKILRMILKNGVFILQLGKSLMTRYHSSLNSN